MVAYLADHFRYHTMNSWNNSTSYAANVKVHNFVPSDLLTKSYEFLELTDAIQAVKEILCDFDYRHKWKWQIFQRGHSGGYLVLISGGQKPSGYKSHCINCGQLNYQKAVDGDETCGVCGGPRRNFNDVHMSVFSWSGKSIDMGEDFSDWDIDSLKERVDLVWDFDQTVEKAKKAFIDFVRNHHVEEEEVLVPKKIKIAVEEP